MIEDIRTVLWKELKEFISQGGRGRLGKVSMFLAFLPGLLLPLQFGRNWLETPLPLITLALVPLIVLTLIADAIAGERERHTLETLLASRLSDRAILFGKIGAATAYVMAQLTAFMLPALILINLMHARDGVAIYSPAVWVGVFLVGPLLAIFACSVGVLVSIRASTVRQAQMVLMAVMFLSFMIVPVILAVLAIIVIVVLSVVVSAGTLEALGERVRESGTILGVLAALAVMIVANLALVRFVETRFRRTRLIVD